MSEKYQFEELDRETRDYLMQAKEKLGKGVPGIFAPQSNPWPIIGMLGGFGLMVLTLLATFPPTGQPVKEALLQTAGFLLGGWMVVAAFRVWTSRKYPGHFVYADPENLYEAKGSTIYITELINLRDARASQNFNNESYTHTDITVKIGKERRELKVKDEERARRMTAFLNAVCYMRDGGEDGKDQALLKLSPEAMGAVAKRVAKTGEFPSNVSSAEEADVARIPLPRRDGRASMGILAIFATIVVGGCLFLVFKTINPSLRDDAVFARVKSIPANDQAPGLRLYLSNPEFKRHRDEAQKMLDVHYDKGVTENVKGRDGDMKKGLSEVVLALKTKPQPVVSFVAIEEVSPEGMNASATVREKTVQTTLADKWGSTIGDELVVFASPADPDNPKVPDRKAIGMIHLRWKFLAGGSIEYTVDFRKSLGEEPVASKTFTVQGGGRAGVENGKIVAKAGGIDQSLVAMTDQILNATIGTVRNRPLAPTGDF